MDYQEIVTAYENNSLDILKLKQQLEKAKLLVGRSKYRILDMINSRSALINDVQNILIIPETEDKVVSFESDLKRALEEYYIILIDSIKKTKAWKHIGIIPSDYSIDKYSQLSIEKKFNVIFLINNKYYKFLEYQYLADIRDCLKNKTNMNDETIKKLQFLILMYNNLKNKDVKREFYYFDSKLIMSAISFRKSKSLRLEEYIATKGKDIRKSYEKALIFFSNEDFRDIAENISLTGKALKISNLNVIEAFAELSESESEKQYLKDELKDFKKLENKYLKMNTIKINYELKQKKIESQKIEKKLLEEGEKLALEFVKRQKQAEERIMKLKQETERQNNNKHDYLKEFGIEVEEPIKEQVHPIIFSWLEKEDITLTRRVSSKVLSEFLDKLRQEENKTGIRTSIFIVTNAGKEVSLKRMQEFQKKAANKGMPNLIEGVLGGYSTFKIDANGKITDIATMSTINRDKIIKLLESSTKVNLNKELIDTSEINFLRYEITNNKDKTINKEYLNYLVNKLLRDPKISKQPLKFLPYIEGKHAGIDVVLKSQLQGISQLPEYYKSKYRIAQSKTRNVKIDTIENFITEG